MLTTILPLLPILLLVITVATLLILRIIRPGFSYFWLIAGIGSSFAALSLLFVWLLSSPPAITTSWRPATLFEPEPLLILDWVSWPYAMALATLGFAIIMTDVLRASDSDWQAWIGVLALTGLGVIAIQAGNLFTLLLGWVAIDFVELVILLGIIRDRLESERAIVAFSSRVLGVVIVLIAGILDRSAGLSSDPGATASSVGVLLIIASGLRLGILPLRLPMLREPPLRRGLGTLLRLLPVSASLVLLARVDIIEISFPVLPYLILLVLFAGLYSAVSWILSTDELEGRPQFILGLATLSLVGALTHHPIASVSWGVTLVVGGGLIFLYATQLTRYPLMPLIGGILLVGLPYTPSWVGSRIYQSTDFPLIFAFLIIQTLIILGYLRHGFRERQGLEMLERWERVIYPAGLTLLLVTYIIIAWLSRWFSQQLGLPPIWPGFVVLGLTGVMGWGLRRVAVTTNIRIVSLSARFFSLGWFYRFMWWLYRRVTRWITFLTGVLEGEGGVLWALLLLLILLSLFIQLGFGFFGSL